MGVDAFILMWSKLARWKLLARLVSLPPVRMVAGLVYRNFANSLEHCQLALKKESSKK